MEWLIAAPGPLLVVALHGGEELIELSQGSREAKGIDVIARRYDLTVSDAHNEYAGYCKRFTSFDDSSLVLELSDDDLWVGRVVDCDIGGYETQVVLCSASGPEN